MPGEVARWHGADAHSFRLMIHSGRNGIWKKAAVSNEIAHVSGKLETSPPRIRGVVATTATIAYCDENSTMLLSLVRTHLDNLRHRSEVGKRGYGSAQISFLIASSDPQSTASWILIRFIKAGRLVLLVSCFGLEKCR
jgi:hypothetical protein